MSDFLATPFAQPRRDLHGASLAARLSGKVSRFFARNIHTKTLALGTARPLVTFTFDDVQASACILGATILERYGVRGTYYVSGGGCGGLSPIGKLATADQVKTLRVNGHEIGCHTFSHGAVAGMSADQLAAEIDRNRSFLQGISDLIAVRNFAYPYGDLSFRTKRYLESRFASCRSLLPGVNSGSIDLGALKAYPLESASTDRDKIGRIVAETAKTKGWLIFNSHDVDERPSRYGVSPDLLELAASAARAAGCHPVTIAEGLELVSRCER